MFLVYSVLIMIIEITFSSTNQFCIVTVAVKCHLLKKMYQSSTYVVIWSTDTKNKFLNLILLWTSREVDLG